jgi:hypothetical protein
MDGFFGTLLRWHGGFKDVGSRRFRFWGHESLAHRSGLRVFAVYKLCVVESGIEEWMASTVLEVKRRVSQIGVRRAEGTFGFGDLKTIPPECPSPRAIVTTLKSLS